MKKIAILDTTNFMDFPIGGQLSSIKNFLKYCHCEKDNNSKFILVGITNDTSHEIGKVNKIKVEDMQVDFLPVAYVNFNENSVGQSLRKIFISGIFKNIKSIKKQKIDIFYIHSIEALLPIVLNFYSKKIVLFSHGNFFAITNFLRFGKKVPFIKQIIQCYIIFSLKYCDEVFVLDDKTKQEYSKYTSSKKIIKVNNSIDLKIYDNDIYKEDKNKYKILYVGRLSENKGIQNIIKSFMYIDNDSITLDIVGLGEEHGKLKKIVKENNLHEKVKFLGKKIDEELVSIYKKSDILVMNSVTEGTPMVILEAMASGLAIVTTPVGNIPYIVRQEYNGEYTDGEPKQIASKILKVIENLNMYKKNSKKESLNYSYMNVNKEIYKYLMR